MWMLQHAGSLPPIKSPHHKTRVDIRSVKNEIRFGFVVKQNDMLYVDVGLEQLISYKGNQLGKKVLVKISNNGQFFAEDIEKNQVPGYWGYDVEYVDSLSELLETQKCEVLMTSVEGSQFTKHVTEMMKRIRISKDLLIVFGGPRFGLPKILESENKKISPNHLLMNMFPRQGTQTVRLEEAILGTLSIVNNYLHA